MRKTIRLKKESDTPAETRRHTSSPPLHPGPSKGSEGCPPKDPLRKALLVFRADWVMSSEPLGGTGWKDAQTVDSFRGARWWEGRRLPAVVPYRREAFWMFR